MHASYEREREREREKERERERREKGIGGWRGDGGREGRQRGREAGKGREGVGLHLTIYSFISQYLYLPNCTHAHDEYRTEGDTSTARTQRSRKCTSACLDNHQAASSAILTISWHADVFSV